MAATRPHLFWLRRLCHLGVVISGLCYIRRQPLLHPVTASITYGYSLHHVRLQLLFHPVTASITSGYRRLCCLGVAISGLTVLAHSSSHLHTTGLLMGTYGVAFAPLRYVLWAHTSPALGLIIAGPSELPACETHLRLTRLVISIMLSGMLATVHPPPLPAAITSGAPGAVPAFLFLWRGGWLAVSCVAMCVALRRMCKLIFKQVAPRPTRTALCCLTVSAWSTFPAIWFLVHLGWISEQQETLLLAMGDFYAKMLASVVLMQVGSHGP